jgi:hypothetical protein
VPELTATMNQTARLSVTLKWTKPDNNGEEITKYTIYMKDAVHQSDWKKIGDAINPSP